MKAFYKTVGLTVLCGLFGKSRQAYYEQKWQKEKELYQDAIIVDLVKHERRVARRVGGRNLYQILKPELEARQAFIGRDRFFDVLRQNDLLVKRRRHSSCDNLTPKEAHTCTGALKKHWKSFAEKALAKAKKEAEATGWECQWLRKRVSNDF
jgi:hypothetical protein